MIQSNKAPFFLSLILAFSFETTSYAAGPMIGRTAKYNIAGRVETGGCDRTRFDMTEVKRLVKDAENYITHEAYAALARGRVDGTMAAGDANACKQLYIDAGNWSLLKIKKLSKAELVEIKMLAAITNNNCNWDDDADKEFSPLKYPEMEAKRSLASERIEEFSSLQGYSEITYAAIDVGYEYGTSKNMKEICPKIEDFARKMKK